MYTVFVPSWCSQINQSLYVHVICCPLTTLVLSYKPVTVCARYLLSSHNVGVVRRSCLCTARVLFFTTGWTAGGHWWTTRVAKDVYDQGNQHNNGPHQDQILDKPSVLCLTMLATNQIRFGVGLIDSPNRLFMNGTGLFFFPSTINYFFFGHFDLKLSELIYPQNMKQKRKEGRRSLLNNCTAFFQFFVFIFHNGLPSFRAV